MRCINLEQTGRAGENGILDLIAVVVNILIFSLSGVLMKSGVVIPPRLQQMQTSIRIDYFWIHP
jgi:hypothetical protein